MAEENWVFLIEAFNDTEADIICGLLETYDIPTRREYTGPYKGLKVVFGQEIGVVIMVPEKLWATAREVITSNNDPQPDK
ncbi:MAG: hypothetical protein WAO23_00055 [Dethiobacteria bacterium]